MKDVITIFPTSVMRKTFDDSFTDEQLDIFINTEKIRNQFNTQSKDSYILNMPELENIKNFCMEGVQEYFDKIIGAKDDVKPYITQSWLNWTDTNESHHQHYHGNSVVSGVFYISTEQDDSIDFIRDEIFPYILIPKEYTLYNSLTCKVFAEEKVLLLFPSHLKHQVRVREGSKMRISLAFNTFVKGKIGSKELLNELIID
jgi:uncharacterized protein (TIGR02466 family)